MRSLSLVMIALLASPLAAQTTTPAQPADPAPITVTGRKVCRFETPLGSNMRQRICTTVAEAKDQARENERRTDAYIRDKNLMSQRTKPCANNC